MERRREKTCRPIHIVIGAGPGGIFCSHELIKYGDVILIEKGTVLNDSMTNNPQQWGTAFSSGKHTELKETIPQERLFSRKILYPMGIGVGGSSNINAMMFSGGHPSVFDNFWPIEWNSTNLTRLFRKITDLVPLKTVSASAPIAGVIDSVRDRSTGVQNDHNRDKKNYSDRFWATESSQSQYFATIDELSFRISLFNKVLEPFMETNVDLYCNLEVICMLLQKNIDSTNARLYTAVGVVAKSMISNEFQIFTPQQGGEIVLSSGALSSPYLLAHSIIIPEDYPLEYLRKSIPPAHFFETIRGKSVPLKLPKIGSFLLDHTILPYICIGNWSCRLDHFFASFPLSGATSIDSPPNSVHGWIFLNERGDIYNPRECYRPPKVQLVFVDGRILCGSMFAEMILPRVNITWYQSYLRPFLFKLIQFFVSLSVVQYFLSNIFAVLICQVQPSSNRGKLDHFLESPHIDPQIGPDDDMTLLWQSYHTVKKIFARAKLSSSVPFYSLEILPGPLVFCRCFMGTYFHFCGTTPMSESANQCSPEYEGVVDSRLRVHHIDKLRIADASVFPSIPSAPIAATVMAVGLAAGEFINDDIREENSLSERSDM